MTWGQIPSSPATRYTLAEKHKKILTLAKYVILGYSRRAYAVPVSFSLLRKRENFLGLYPSNDYDKPNRVSAKLFCNLCPMQYNSDYPNVVVCVSTKELTYRLPKRHFAPVSILKWAYFISWIHIAFMSQKCISFQNIGTLFAPNNMTYPESISINLLNAPGDSTVQCDCGHINCPFCNLMMNLELTDH